MPVTPNNFGVTGFAFPVVSSGGTADYPAQTDVRDGTVYDFGAMIGSLQVVIVTGDPTSVATGSVGGDIEGALLAQLQNVIFAGIDPANVVARKLPHVGENLGINPPCLLLAAAAKPEARDAADTEGNADSVYPFEVAIVKGTQRSMASDPEVRKWRLQAMHAVESDAAWQAVKALVPSVWEIEIDPDPLFDRGSLSDQYAYSSFTVRVKSYAQR